MLKRLKIATEEATKQREDFEDFKLSCSKETVDTLDERMEAWENDTDSKDNPYTENLPRMSVYVIVTAHCQLAYT